MARKEKKEIQAIEERQILKNALKERGMMQVDLADKLGILQSAVSGNINRRRMGLDVFSTMLNAMDYDVAVVDRETGEIMWKVAVK